MVEAAGRLHRFDPRGSAAVNVAGADDSLSGGASQAVSLLLPSDLASRAI